MTEHIILAYGFDGNGSGMPLQGDDISKLIKSDKLAWVHLDANQPATKTWLEQNITYLDPLIIEALLEEETRPRASVVNDGILLILRGANLNENADPEDMISIRLWVDQHRIISIQRQRLRAIGDIEESLKQQQGPGNAADFVCTLIERLFERMSPALNELNDTTDDIEEKILESADISLRQAIVDVRMQAILFRRHMSPQRDAIERLRMTELDWFDANHRRHLQESFNQVTRYIEDLDAVRERAQIVKDELANILTDRLNKNMYILSVIAAIFLPLGFLTGLLGINVGGIPGAENPEAFWMFGGLLCFLVLLQVILFKKLKWF